MERLGGLADSGRLREDWLDIELQQKRYGQYSGRGEQQAAFIEDRAHRRYGAPKETKQELHVIEHISACKTSSSAAIGPAPTGGARGTGAPAWRAAPRTSCRDTAGAERPAHGGR